MYKALISFCNEELDIKQGDILASDFASADVIADLLEAGYIEVYTDPSGGAKIEVVTELPEIGEANVIYLVPKQDEDENNVFDEYLYVNDEWELIGTTDIDLSGYQPLLTAGNNITIENNVISALSSGGVIKKMIPKDGEEGIVCFNDEEYEPYTWYLVDAGIFIKYRDGNGRPQQIGTSSGTDPIFNDLDFRQLPSSVRLCMFTKTTTFNYNSESSSTGFTTVYLFGVKVAGNKQISSSGTGAFYFYNARHSNTNNWTFFGTNDDIATGAIMTDRYIKGKIIYNGLDATQSNTYALDATQGKVLNDTKEAISNKVTSITASSTNTQYPSALAVKTYVDSAISTAITDALGGSY